MKNREYREHASRHLERPALARGSARDHLRGPGGIEGESETQSNFQGRRGSGKYLYRNHDGSPLTIAAGNAVIAVVAAAVVVAAFVVKFVPRVDAAVV